jgi:hypothetical protein
MTTSYRYQTINLLEHIKEIHKPVRENNIYNTLSGVYNTDILNYLIIIVLLLFLFNFLSISLNHILGFAISFLVINFLIQRDKETINTFTTDNENKLKFLNSFLTAHDTAIPTSNMDIEDQVLRPLLTRSYLKLDPIIVNFLYDIREYMFYNASVYRKIVQNVNNLLLFYNRIKFPKEYKSPYNNNKYNYDIIVDCKNRALNNLHSMIYMLDSNELDNKKYNDSIVFFQQILEGYLNEVEKIIQDECKQNLRANSHFIEIKVPDNNNITNSKGGFHKNFDFFN